MLPILKCFEEDKYFFDVEQWFSNWGPRDNFLGTAKHLPKAQKQVHPSH